MIFLEAEAFAEFKSVFTDIVNAVVQMIRYGAYCVRDVSSFITANPLVFVFILIFCVGLAITLIRRLISL